MKNLLGLFTLAAVVAISCNKTPSSNATTPPWSGNKPASATINGKNYFAKTGIFALNAVPLPSTIITTVNDTTIADSIFTVKTLGLTLPNGGGAVNTNIIADSANKEYIVTYSAVQKSMRAFNLNTVLSDRTFTSQRSIEGVRLKIYSNTATEITGTFFGYLGRLDKVEEVFIDNGYFSITK